MPRRRRGWLDYVGFLLPIRGLFDGVFETYYPLFFIRVIEVFTGDLDRYPEDSHLGLFDYLLVFPAIIRCFIHYGVSWDLNDEYGLVRETKDLIRDVRIALMAIILPIPLSAFLYFYWLPVTIGLLALAATQLMIMTYIYCKEFFNRPPPAQGEFLMLNAMRTMYQYLRPAPPAPLLEPGVKVDVYGSLDHYAFMIESHLEKTPERIPSLQAKLPNGNAVFFSEVKVAGKGDCAFITMGVTRDQVVRCLLPLMEKSDIRDTLAEEIRQALETGEFRHPEWQALLDIRHTQYHLFDELIRGIHNRFPEWMPQPGQAQPDQESSLIAWLKEKNPDMPEIAEILEQRLARFRADEEIRLYCESEPVAKAYIMALERELWLGYQSALLYAKHNNMSLYIWRKEGLQNPNQLQLIDHHKSGQTSQIIHMLHTNRFTHFNLLVRQKALEHRNVLSDNSHADEDEKKYDDALDLPSQPAKRVTLPANYENYRCPISQMIMSNPTQLNCGHIFEQTEIERWRGGHDQVKAAVNDYDELCGVPVGPENCECCPMCRELIRTLTPNQVLKEEITAFLYTVRHEWDPLMQAILTEEDMPGWNTFKANTDIFLREGNAETLLKECFVDAISNFVTGRLLERVRTAVEECPDPCRNAFRC